MSGSPNSTLPHMSVQALGENHRGIQHPVHPLISSILCQGDTGPDRVTWIDKELLWLWLELEVKYVLGNNSYNEQSMVSTKTC